MLPAPLPTRLLLVDDEVALLESLRVALQQEGFEVTAFADPAAALGALPDGGFDLLLSDLTMPGADGIHVLRQALQIDPELVVVIMTGHGSAQDAVEALAAGAFAFLQKPFRMRHVRPVLHRALEVRRLRAENARLRAEVKRLRAEGGC